MRESRGSTCQWGTHGQDTARSPSWHWGHELTPSLPHTHTGTPECWLLPPPPAGRSPTNLPCLRRGSAAATAHQPGSACLQPVLASHPCAQGRSPLTFQRHALGLKSDYKQTQRTETPVNLPLQPEVATAGTHGRAGPHSLLPIPQITPNHGAPKSSTLPSPQRRNASKWPPIQACVHKCGVMTSHKQYGASPDKTTGQSMGHSLTMG